MRHAKDKVLAAQPERKLRVTRCSVRCFVIALLFIIACECAVTVGAEEPITPIGMLLVNPSAFHRKLLKVEGIAKRGQDLFKI
jgi:hypothetical protein